MKNYRLYLVRHGVTQGNLDGIYMGSGTDQPLCAQGAAQLRALAARFPYPKAETVFSSPMRRAVETVELLFPDAKDKIILADLRENAFGEFDGAGAGCAFQAVDGPGAALYARRRGACGGVPQALFGCADGHV